VVKNLAVWLFFGMVLACDACQTYRMFEMQKAIMVLDMWVEGLNRFCATLLDIANDIDAKLVEIKPDLPPPTMPMQHFEFSNPVYKIPGGDCGPMKLNGEQP
jgi:hypothetical protein